ncbi:MAG: hypothetical protein U1F71_02060 [Verrucomicrobiaceae bacterium]
MPRLHPVLMSSDFDPFQVVVVVIFLIAGFIKWLWENWQLKREAAQREQKAPDPEQQRMREAAWRKQTGQDQPPPLPARPTSAPTPAAPTAWDELRKAWRELQEAAKQAQAPPPRQAPAPPSPPPMPRAQSRNAVKAAPSASPVPSPVAAATVPSRGAAVPVHATFVAKTTPGATLVALRNLRHDPVLLRQAILMREILGPPKALQISDGPAI